jgi:hypothetical protein
MKKSLKNLLKKHYSQCYLCGLKFRITDINNLLPICPSCNSQKITFTIKDLEKKIKKLSQQGFAYAKIVSFKKNNNVSKSSFK